MLLFIAVTWLKYFVYIYENFVQNTFAFILLLYKDYISNF